MRHATRVLEVQAVDGVDTFAICGFNRREDESLASSTSSGAVLPPGFEIESVGNSPRQQHQLTMGLAEGDRQNGADCNITETANKAKEKTPSSSTTAAGIEAGLLMECRIRRLEVGRRRAEGIRRAASARRVAEVANKQREMLLARNAGVLASAKSSFESLLQLPPPGTTTAAAGTMPSTKEDAVLPATAGLLERGHILALRERFVRELSGEKGPSAAVPPRKRDSVQIVVDAVRKGGDKVHRGSVQMMAEVRELTLNLPGLPARNHSLSMHGGSSSVRGGDASPAAAATKSNGGEKERGGDKHGTMIEGDGAVLVPPPGTDDRPQPDNDDADTAVALSRVTENKEAASSKIEGDLDGKNGGGTDDTAIAEGQHDPEKEQCSPVVKAEAETPSQQQQQQQEGRHQHQQQRKHPSTRRSTKGGDDIEGATSNVDLDDLLAAVGGLLQKVEEDGPMGAAAYAAWWVGAVSEAELELKNKFLAPKFLGG